MTDQFRAMCAELVDALDSGIPVGRIRMSPLADRARTLLAQPVAEGPTDQEIEEWADTCPEASLEEMDPEVHGWRRCFTAKEFSETIRAALARWGRPTPQPPADGEVAELVECLRRICFDVAPCDADAITRAADLLAQRYPTPVPVLPDDALIIEPAEHTLLVPVAQPVPVSERWPGPEDCDEQERCWLWERDCGYSGCKWALVDRTWSLSQSNQDLSVYTHWLPANALPTPEATND